MIEIKTKLRKWGNSFGVVVPQRVVKIEKAKEGDEITIFIRREKPHLKKVFGSLKNWKINPQKFKNDIRREEAEKLLS